MMMLGKTDDSAGAGRKEYYTVLLEEGAMADVMAVYDMEGGEGLDTSWNWKTAGQYTLMIQMEILWVRSATME